jgi:ATP-dependent Clp protease ATP-binding subunit ClpC
MEIQVSEEMSRILGYSREEAMRTGAYEIGTDHLLLGLLRHSDNLACKVLVSLGVDLDDFKHYVESLIFKRESVPYDQESKLRFSREARGTLNMSVLETSTLGDTETRSQHLLLAICRSTAAACKTYLEAEGINRDSIASFLRDANAQAELHKAPKPAPTTRVLHIVIGKPKIYS